MLFVLASFPVTSCNISPAGQWRSGEGMLRVAGGGVWAANSEHLKILHVEEGYLARILPGGRARAKGRKLETDLGKTGRHV